MDLPWPLSNRPDLRDRLIAAYSTGRGYHDLMHLSEVLERLEELGVEDPDVLLAAWFHDAVYDDQGDNEERSAQLALRELAGIEGVDAEEVARLVRLTTSHSPAAGDDRGALLCDADLGILAAPRARYEEYVAGVRREYVTYSDTDFARGRLAVLENLASRPHLFQSAEAQAWWEPAARANLAREIEELRAVLRLAAP